MVEENSEDTMDEDSRMALDSGRIVQEPALELAMDKQNSLNQQAELDELAAEDALSLEPEAESVGALSMDSDLEEPMERRAFLRHRLKASADADQSKLKSKGSRTRFLGRGKRAKRRKKRTKPNQAAPKSSQTRQSSTSHIGTSTVAGAEQSGAANSLASTLKQHLPSINLSGSMQKLIMSKLGPTNPSIALFKHQQQVNHQESPQYIEASGQAQVAGQVQPVASASGDANLLIRHASGFIENPRLAEYSWPPGAVPSSMQSASEDNGAYFPTLSAEPNKMLLHNKPNKMIPVEIVGLDPVVASSILRDSASSAQILGEPHHAAEAGSPPRSSPLLFEPQQQMSPHDVRLASDSDHMRSTAKSSSILHIHHFHHPSSQANSILGSNSVQQSSSPVGGDQDALNSENSHPNSSDEPPRQPMKPKLSQGQHEQTFVNDKGELVYLAVDEQTGPQTDTVADQQQPDKAEGDMDSTQHPEEQSKSAAWNHRGALLGKQQQPFGVSSPNQAGSELRQRIYLTKSGQPVSVIGRAKSPSLQDDQQRLLMVSYKPQQHNAIQNTTLVEPEPALRAPFNDGQESRPGLLSSKHLLDGASFVLNSVDKQAQHSPQLDHQQQILPTEHLNFIRSRLLASNSSSLLDSAAKQQAQSENRVPSKPTLVNTNESGLLTLVNNEASPKNGSAPFWSRPEVGLVNGYLDSKQTLLKTKSEISPTGQRNNMLNSAELYKHLSNTLVDNLGNKHEPLNVDQVSLGNSQSNKLTNQQLLSLLTDLRSANSSTLDKVLLAPNMSVTDQLAQHEILRPIGKLASGQALEEAARYNKLSDYSPVPPPQLSRPFNANSFEPLEPHPARQRHQKFKTDGNRQDWSRGVGSTRNTNYSSAHADEPPDFALSDSNGGVSNLAMTFIFIISLVTVALVAVSMVYRLRRRRQARCNGPPSRRSRPNLSQRAERFVRSSLSSSNGASISAMDTPSLCERKGSLSGAKLNHKNNTMTTNGRVVVHSLNVATAANDPVGNSLSTFTGNHDKYPAASELSSSSTGCPDMRPIHTRLQKPTYLKSVISTSPPECLLNQNQNQNKKTNNKYSDSSCYLNFNKQRQTTAAVSANGVALTRHFGSSHSNDQAKVSSGSFKKLGGSCDHGQIVNARSSYKRMSVIHSGAEESQLPVPKQQVHRIVASRKSVTGANASRLYDASRSTEFVDRL